MTKSRLAETDFEDAAKKALEGKRAEAVGAVVAILATVASGHPLAGVLAGKGAEWFANRLIDGATERLNQAEKQYDDEQDKLHILKSELRAGVAPFFAAALDELDGRDQERFLQTIRYIDRNVASASGQVEILDKLRQLEQELRGLIGGRSDFAQRRTAADILRHGIARRPSRHRNPAALLTARYEVVPFVESARIAELREIESWCRAAELVGVRLFLGPGGAGKTRLFIEAAKRLRDGVWDNTTAWDAGFLPEGASERDERDVLDSTRSVLLVVDYAEVRRELPRLLTAVAEVRPGARKIRVALVARKMADWWHLLLGLSGPIADLLQTHEPVTLRSRDLPLKERQEVFERSVHAFASELGRPIPRAMIDLSDPRLGCTLYVAMAALAAVDAANLAPEHLLGGALEHEKRYLKLHYFDDRTPDLREQSDFLERTLRLLAAATLRGGLATREDTDAISRMVGGPDATHTPHVIRLLHSLYSTSASTGKTNASTGWYLPPLEPGLLGEELVAQVLASTETSSDYLSRVFEGAPVPAVCQGFILLGRLAARGFEERHRHWIASVLNADLEARAVAAFDAALSLGEETAHTSLGLVLHRSLESVGNPALAREFLSRMPEKTVALREIAAWSADQVLKVIPRDATKERAELLTLYGKWLQNLGRREDAFAATEEAVAHNRTLASMRPDAFLPGLATSLNNLGTMLTDLGRLEEALAATEEAVRHRRTLVSARPNVFLPALAGSLNNLGAVLSDLGRLADAFAATEEAVRHYRALVSARPEAFLPDLAGSLSNLGLELRDLGRGAEALAAAEEAVRHYRTLAAGRPDAFLPDLAMSLLNLGQSELRKPEDALAAAEEAVRHYRTLAAARPDAFLANLANSLNSLGAKLCSLDKATEAVSATEEAIHYYRNLVDVRPSVFLPELAMSLHNLGVGLRVLGRRDALTVAEEAVRHFRSLASTRPDAHLPALATSLNNLGIAFNYFGRREDALDAMAEAVGHYRTLSSARPDTFLPQLAMGLHNLGLGFHELGRRDDALAAAEEAVLLTLRLASAHDGVFLPALAARAAILQRRVNDLGKSPESSAALVAAKELLRKVGDQ